MRNIRMLFCLSLLAFLIGFSPGGIAQAGPPALVTAAQIEQQVWNDLAAAPTHWVRFVVNMQETSQGDSASAIPAQMALEQVLTNLEGLGTITYHAAYYGANAIIVEGGLGALRFLAEWPEVAAIHAYSAENPWETLEAPASMLADGHITGKVTGPNGTTALANMRVRAYLFNGGSSWSITGMATTAADGRYNISGQATGFYRAEFYDPAGSYVSEFYNNQLDWDNATIFSVTDGLITPNINASLALAGRISGTVRAANNNKLLADIVISACQYSNGACPIMGSAITGTDGTYTITGLPPGAYRVRFADGYSVPRYVPQFFNGQLDPNLATLVNVVASQTTPNINALMGGYGKITGKVTAIDGTTALDNIFVDVYQYNATDLTWDWVGSGITDSSGSYDVDGLATNDYRVGFTDSKGQFADEFYNNKASVETGDNIHVILGTTTANINVSLAPKTVNLTRSLAGGWNLVSLPLTQGNPAPAAVFSSLGTNYSLVYAYDGCLTSNQWTSYNPNIPPNLNTLTSINVKQGLWVQTKAAVALNITGTWPISTSINLCTGWNLIGYPSATTKSVSSALAGIAGKYSLVYGYDATDTADPWKKYDPAFQTGNDLTALQPWMGYWIRMTTPATLVVIGR